MFLLNLSLDNIYIYIKFPLWFIEIQYGLNDPYGLNGSNQLSIDCLGISFIPYSSKSLDWKQKIQHVLLALT